MSDPNKTSDTGNSKTSGRDENSWYERTERSDGSSSILGGDTNSTDGSHYHAVYNNDEDRTLDYFRGSDQSRDEAFDTRKGDKYPDDK